MLCQRLYCYYMTKKRRVPAVAGEQDTSIGFRCSTDLRERFSAALLVGIKRDKSNTIRPFIEDYVEFTEIEQRQPNDLKELYAWVLKKKK